MNVLLAALNAKFFHSPLALYSLKTYCKGFSKHINIVEYTINNDKDFIIRDIYGLKPDIIGFSCYVWNHEFVLEIAQVIRKILPKTVIVLGGPETSYDNKALLEEGVADIIVMGEGEEPFLKILEYYIDKKGDLSEISNIAYRDEGQVHYNRGAKTTLELDRIALPYESTVSIDENKIIYYETSRGCPYDCQYCLSSISHGVRFLSLERCFADLDFFIKEGVKQVKFVDRTFNCDKNRGNMIWKHLIKNDNGKTNFHFEIGGDLLDKESLDLLKTARLGLFQFEIGVQTTNEQTLTAICRKTDLDMLFSNINDIVANNNIHVHLDLIAGLPYEDYLSFKNSFNNVYALKPQQLQLGFLKVLKGSGLKANASQYGIVYKDKAPYEALFTKDISYGEMVSLKNIEEMVEVFYNSYKFRNTLAYVMDYFHSPFEFYEALSKNWVNNGYHRVSHNKASLYNMMYEFLMEHFPNEEKKIGELIKFDMLVNDIVPNMPAWGALPLSEEEKQGVRVIFKSCRGNEKNKLVRKLHVEKFCYDIAGWVLGEGMTQKPNYVLFDYTGDRNVLTGSYGFKKVEVSNYQG